MPGEKLPLTINVFNAIGQQLPDSAAKDVKLSIEGPAKIDGKNFIANDDAMHTAATVTATLGDLTGSARIRIIPSLPWKFTFDNLTDAPLPWVGARYRHIIKSIDGSPALVKISTIPKGARSQAWMGPSNLSNYTIQADVRAPKISEQLPDIGLSNQGYILDLMGQGQELQIRTWSAQLRIAETIPFEWKENRWYQMKFQVELESEPPAATAIMRGKVWPRGEPEPAEWTITAHDESPVMAASPGLYGNAKASEFYMDNIEVTPNK